MARKLEASQIFMPAAAPDEEVPAALGEASSTVESGSAENLSEAALDAVRALGGAPKPIAIRKRIAKDSPALAAKLAASPNYFYTVLGRHLQARRLIKHGKGYRLPKDSPHGETGAVAAPAPSQQSRQSVEAAYNGPKGNGAL